MSKHDASQMNREARRSLARKGGALGSAGLLAGGATTALFAAFALPASATTLTVDTTADGVAVAGDCTNGTAGDCSLRDALAAAASGDTITFAPSVTGTITLTQGQLRVVQPVTLTGPGASALTIDGAQQSRVFYVTNFVYGDVSISGVTITGGNETSPSNGTGAGALIKNFGNATFDHVVVDQNSTSDVAGGLYFGNQGNATISNSVISANSAVGSIGGVGFGNSGSATVDRSTIDGNTSSSAGGGVDVYGPSSFTMSNSTISGNTAARQSGGLGLSSTLTSYIYNSTIAGNVAAAGGGISVGPDVQLTVDMSTISGNTATGANVNTGNQVAAGGISAFKNSQIYLYGVIVSGNTAADPTISDMGFGGPSSNTGLLDTHSCVLGNYAGQTLYGDENVYSTTPGLGALADNGGPTKTMALLSGSVAIDAGPDPVPTFPGDQFDQRGGSFGRIVNGRSDIGAFEVQSDPAPTTSTTVPGADPVVPQFTG